MICPYCKNEISRVIVISHASQDALVNGNKIISYDDVTLSETVDIRCSACDASIMDDVEE